MVLHVGRIVNDGVGEMEAFTLTLSTLSLRGEGTFGQSETFTFTLP